MVLAERSPAQPRQSEALVIGTVNQLQVTASVVSTVSVAGVQLPVADQMKVLPPVLGPLLFAAYTVADCRRHSEPRCVCYHQYAAKTQLHLATRADDCTVCMHVRQWYLQNCLQLNPDKSEALVIGIVNQLQATTSVVSTVSIAGVQLPVADQMKVL